MKQKNYFGELQKYFGYSSNEHLLYDSGLENKNE